MTASLRSEACSPVSEASSLDLNAPEDSKRDGNARSMDMLQRSLKSTGPAFQISETSPRLSNSHQSMLLPEDRLVNHQVSAVKEKHGRTKDGYGKNTFVPFAKFDPDTSLWRMYRGCSLPITGEPSAKYSETWPKAGMMQNGIAYLPSNSELLTFVIGYSLLPTPTAKEGGRNRSDSKGSKVRPSLGMMARKGLWPTPRASERGDYQYSQGRHDHPVLTLIGMIHALEGSGPENPALPEWLMGFPPGWTESGALEIQSSPSKQNSSENASSSTRQE